MYTAYIPEKVKCNNMRYYHDLARHKAASRICNLSDFTHLYDK